jgi:hypothetical protein
VRGYIKKTNLPLEQQQELIQFTESLRKGLQHSVNYKTNMKIITEEYNIRRVHLKMLMNAKQKEAKVAETEHLKILAGVKH